MGAEQSTAAAAPSAGVTDKEPAQAASTAETLAQGPVAEADAASPPTASPSALVVVGPSGVGKGTLIKLLMDGDSRFGFSTSHTTRQPRPGEKVRGRSNL